MDRFAMLIGAMLPTIAVFSWMMSFTTLVKGIVHEREHRLADVMATHGLGDGINPLGWLLATLFLLTINAAFFATYLHQRRVLPESNVVLVFILFELFAVATIAFGFAISGLFSHSRLASAASAVIYVASFLPYAAFANQEGRSYSQGTKYAMCLFPTTAFAVGGFQIAGLERSDGGVQWKNVAAGVGSCDDFTLLLVFGFLVFDSILYVAVARSLVGHHLARRLVG
jgi:hypothetical protein